MAQHAQFIEKAKAMGASIQDVSHLLQQNAAVLNYQSISELIIDGVPASWVNARSQIYCDNKQLTKLAYDYLQLPYLQSITFQTPKDSSLQSFLREDQVYVCKPLDIAQGIGVVMGIKNFEEVIAYYHEYKHLNRLFMLEEQDDGKDLRLQVIGGKIVAACIREPAFVLGNGMDSLQSLIGQRRAVMHTQNPKNVLEIDEATKSLLEEQNLSLLDIPKKVQKVQLKRVSNMAQGGVATDVTDEIHPLYQDWVTALVEYLKTPYFALDLLTQDHRANPHEASKILEINAFADWLHHTFSERRTHDIGGMILEELGVTF
ncbi:MAG: hypothetical protein ACPGVB_15100 [Chitinophagales bacterium]